MTSGSRPPKGASAHVEGCECPRCVGFSKGNQLGLRHGAYSVIALRGRVAELADELRSIVPNYSPSDAPAVEALATTLGRIERGQQALDEVDEAAGDRALASYVGEAGEAVERLRQDMRGWLSLARRLGHDLGLSPRARWELNLVAADAVAAGQRIDLEALPIADRVKLLELVDRATVTDEVAS